MVKSCGCRHTFVGEVIGGGGDRSVCQSDIQSWQLVMMVIVVVDGGD